MIRLETRCIQGVSSAPSDVYKSQTKFFSQWRSFKQPQFCSKWWTFWKSELIPEFFSFKQSELRTKWQPFQ